MSKNNEIDFAKKLEGELQMAAFRKSESYYDAQTIYSNELILKSMYSVPSSDLQMIENFNGVFGKKYVYVPESQSRGTFYAWDGTIWAPVDKQSFGNTLAKSCSYFLRAILNGSPLFKVEGKSLSNHYNGMVTGLAKDDPMLVRATDQMKAIKGYSKNLESNNGLKNLEKQIKSHLEVSADYFDNDSDYIVFEDGMVLLTRELEKGLQAPDQSRAVSRKLAIASTHVDPQPRAWQVALDNWQPSVDDQKYLQVAAGAALLGQGTAKNVVCIYGRSNTGKSTYARTIAGVFGGYAGTMWPTGIEQSYSTNWEQSAARGARFLLVEEPSNRTTDDSFLKNLSGGGSEVKTQDKGKDPVAWRPQCVLHMTSNVKPNINTSDLAMVKRLNFVEFEHVFEFGQDTAAKEYEDTLLDLAGMAILNWILEGARLYEELERIPLSKGIIEKAQENVADNSSVIQWIDELFENQFYENGCVRLVTTDSPTVAHYLEKPKAYKYYRAWCRTTDEDFPMSKKDFARDVKSRLNIGKFPKSMGDERIPNVVLEHSETHCSKDKEKCPNLAMLF